MSFRSRPSPGGPPAAALDPDLLRSGGILICRRSGFILSALVFEMPWTVNLLTLAILAAPACLTFCSLEYLRPKLF